MSKTTTLLLVLCLILAGCENHKSRSDQSALQPDSLSEFHSHAQQLFDKARELQKGEDYPAAISLYQQLDSISSRKSKGKCEYFPLPFAEKTGAG